MAKDIRETIEQAIEKLDKAPPGFKEAAIEAITDMVENKKTIKEALGYTQEAMDSLYKGGYAKFQSGKFQEALKIFVTLQYIDPKSFDYAFATAVCYHHMKEYENAIGSYMVSTGLDITNPLPWYHMFDCFLQLNNPVAAIFNLRAAITLADQDKAGKYKELKEKGLLEYKKLKVLIKNTFNKEP